MAMAVVGIVLGLAMQLRVAIESARQSAREQYCRNNLRQLSIALHNYHDTWNCFPPARYDDANGKPMHSWRVLITPFYEASSFYSQYSFAEPWSGPSNSTLENGPWKRFICPSSPTPGNTNYVAVVGPGTMWPDGKQAKIDDLVDGTSNTLMIVEIAHSDILWMEPRDLPVGELAAWLDPKHKPQLLGNHIEGGMVAYADGHVELLSRDVTIERLKAIVTAAGNDVEEGLPLPRP